MFKALVAALIASCSALVIVPLFSEMQIELFLRVLSKGSVLLLVGVVGFSFITALLQAIRGDTHG